MADILIIEPNEILARRFMSLLHASGYTTRAVKTHLQAKPAILKSIPALILMKTEKDQPQTIQEKGFTPLIIYTDGTKILTTLLATVEELLAGDTYQKEVGL